MVMDTNHSIIFITGGTGNFGRLLVKNLLETNTRVALLIRSDSQEQAQSKVKKIFDSVPGIEGKMLISRGDLREKNLGLSTKEILSLKRNVTHILHAAATTRFTLPLNKARENNVEITKNLLNFAGQCSKLRRFGFVGTSFVAGKRTGRIMEDEFEHTEGFINTYQQSKYEAELLVRNWVGKLPIAVFRPSLILGQLHKTSKKTPINALALGLFLASKGFLPILPGDKENRLDIIDGKDAARTIIELFLKDRLRSLTYHTTSAEKAPTLENLISLLENKSGRKLAIRFCGDMGTFSRELKRITRFRPDLALVYKKTESFLPELAYPKIFDHSNVLKELGASPVQSDTLEEIKSILR